MEREAEGPVNESDVSTPEVCETCQRGAQYGRTCSSGFHMCHACTWRNGERITTCRDCQELEAQSLITRYVVLCDLELSRQDNVTRVLSVLPDIRWWRYIPNAWLVIDLQGRDATWWRDFVRRAGAPEVTADLRSRIVVLRAKAEDWSAVLASGEQGWLQTVWSSEDAAVAKATRCNCGAPDLATAHRADCPVSGAA
jgi:hypothetical protein